MKKLKTTIPNGGAPLGQFPVLRELFDEETKNAIEASIFSLVDGQTEGVILKGCTVSGSAGNFAISSGYIYADGEVLYYAGGSGFSATQYLKKAAVTEESGTFADSVVRAYIDVNEATDYTTSGGGAGTQYITVTFASGGRTLHDYLKSAASTTAQGIAELATNAEVQAGSDTTRIVTPSGLNSRTATEARTGIAELATQTEVNTGTDDTRIVTPLKLATRTATESLAGIIQIASQTVVNAGTDDTRAVTPLKLKTINTGAVGSSTADIITFNVATDGLYIIKTVMSGHRTSDPSLNGMQENTLLVRRASGALTIHNNAELVGYNNGGANFTFSFVISGLNLILRGSYTTADQCKYQAELHYITRVL